ncbi:hypothetical protein TSMEX_000590 [Taenia solium]|eukprot:TsM_000550700 transcript=TsM_000550700 gene=TsM_000550700
MNRFRRRRYRTRTVDGNKKFYGLIAIILFLIIELQFSTPSIDRILQKCVQSVGESNANEFTNEEEELIASTQCQWPPSDINNIMVNKVFNVALCVQGSRRARAYRRVKEYTLQELFGLSKIKGSVTFEGMSLLPRRFWNRMRVPRVYQTYPQDVPMSDIVKAVKQGHSVPEVSLFQGIRV